MNMLAFGNSGAPRASSRFTGLVGATGALAFGLLAFQAAAQQSPPFGLPDKGVLRLQLGGGASSRFLHEPSLTSQSILLSGKCGLVLGSPSLATLTAAGGLGSMGLGPDSIGVFDGPRGVACYRITASLSESVTFGLGSATSALPIGANAFYRLELDIEVKQNAAFLLEILIGGTVAEQFYLRSGSSIIAGEGSSLPGSPDDIFNCSAQSDSGPDAGLRDNCRWIVEALGQQFRLIPLVGEGSLEGGGDFGTGLAAKDNNSLIYLTKANVGALGCLNTPVPQDTSTSTIGDGVNDAQCTITRIDPTGIGGSCTTAVGYVLRNIGVAEGCEMLKTPGEQLAASADMLFPPEPRTALGAEPLTEIVFNDSSGVPYMPGSPFVPQRCTGTVVLDRNGERTIREVLDGGTVGYDHVPGGYKDWACILDNKIEYLGGNQMQVRQTILFWGDIEIKRQPPT
jgi:hypothetical protein